MLFSDGGYVAGMKAGRPAQRPRTPFGERMAEARELAGMTQLQLAEKVGASQEVIAYWERKPVALRRTTGGAGRRPGRHRRLSARPFRQAALPPRDRPESSG